MNTQWPLLDALRAGAAFLVLLGHARNWFFPGIGSVEDPGILLQGFWFVTVLHHEAVVVFFVLSGFLVGGSALPAIANRTFDAKSYMTDRAVRIFIVYLPALALTAGLSYVATLVFTDPGPGSLRPIFQTDEMAGEIGWILCHAAGIEGFACRPTIKNPALWSLGYEWVFYLMGPLLFYAYTRRGVFAFSLVVYAFLIGVVYTVAVEPNGFLFYIGLWCLGVGAREVFRRGGLHISLGLLGICLAGAAMAVSRLKLVDLHWTDAMISVGIAAAISAPGLMRFEFGARFFSAWAGFSYSLYATHVPVIYFLLAALPAVGFESQRTLSNAFVQFLLTVLVSLAVAYAFYFVTERHTDGVRHWVKHVMKSRTARAAQVG